MTKIVGLQRGQSALDLLMLILLLSTALLALTAFSRVDLNPLAIRANALQDKRALLAVLEQRVELNNSDVTIMRGRVIDLMAFQACNGCINGSLDYCTPLQRAVNSTLVIFNGQQRNFLLRALSASRLLDLTAFDNSSSVCLERLPLARFSHNTTCGEPFTVEYASWLPWQQVVGAC